MWSYISGGRVNIIDGRLKIQNYLDNLETETEISKTQT